MVSIELPWPPSINHYWRRCGSRYFVSAEGIKFRKIVCTVCMPFKGHFKAHERLSLVVEAYPPDRRRRDLDNILKSLMDSLQHAEVYVDDNQIDYLSIRRTSILTGVVTVNMEVIG